MQILNKEKLKMGKPTGFMDYNRVSNISIAPLDRIKNFNEFHKRISEDDRKQQASRCMNCGVPFCQSGMVLNGMKTGCLPYCRLRRAYQILTGPKD